MVWTRIDWFKSPPPRFTLEGGSDPSLILSPIGEDPVSI